MAEGLMLEVIEGPDAGLQVALEQPIAIGRAAENDLVLADGKVSRRHAKVTPAPGASAVVEDLGSVNGTFVNQDELHGTIRFDAGDNSEVLGPESGPAPARVPELEKYLDGRVRRRAQLAPLALFALVALALTIYLATR